MAGIIEVTENGSNRKLTIVVSNILYVEPLQYNDGTLVTVITLIENKMIHVVENIVNVKGQIRNA